MNSTQTKVTIVSIWLNTQSLQENQENEGGGISWALAKGVETARKPMEERKERTEDSMRQVPLYGGATMEQRPLMWFVRRSEMVGLAWISCSSYLCYG